MIDRDTLTADQADSIHIIAKKYGTTVSDLLQTASASTNGCVLVAAGGMWIGVETDGHRHS